MKSIFFCCDIFTELINNAGNRGFSVVLAVFPYPERVSDENKYKFFLQSRNVDYGEREKKTNTVIQSAINYCPWCGCKLSNIIVKNKKEVEHLTDKNKHLFL